VKEKKARKVKPHRKSGRKSTKKKKKYEKPNMFDDN
jgi:hypothetical protein